jgi:citronellol/citronellal dehydrogenase
VNALWPRTVIGTAALAMLGDMVKPENCRTPAIVADAACEIFKLDSKVCTGNFFSDEEILRKNGVENFDQYAVDSSKPLQADLFLD